MMPTDDLDDLLLLASVRAVDLPPGLLGRVLDDATRLQPQPPLPATARRAVKPRSFWSGSFWSGLAWMMGGAGAAAGLGAAAVTGLVVGFVQPAGLATLAETLNLAQVTTSVSLMPSIDFGGQ